MKKNNLSYLFKTFAVAGLVAAVISGCSKEADDIGTFPGTEGAQTTAVAVTHDGYKIVPNEMLVKFKPGTSSLAREVVLRKVNGSVKEKIHTKAMKHFGDNEGITVVKTPMAVPDAVGRMKNLPEIEYAEPNFIYTVDATSNDPYYTNGSLWGMYGDASPLKTNAFGSQAGEAWAAGNIGSKTVYIGIIDEGYMYTHEDLATNAGTNPGEIAGNGVDDDGNGYVDDVYGWDFDGNNNTVFDGTADDHGTHVAGTIGAVGGNGKGVAGVCWNVKLLDAKFLGTKGGTTDNAIKAVDYFTDLKTRHGLNLVATNNSWGGGGYSALLEAAIGRANNTGILFIAAAGNESNNNDVTASYPSGYDVANVIAVASITNTGALSSFSNYGATTVDLGAPGSAIYSCVPVKSRNKIVSGYASYSGTSMATPHVTGAAALYASTHPGATAANIKNAILTSVVPTSSLAGKCVTGGRLNVSGF
jgi:subtilisin family serine protease